MIMNTLLSPCYSVSSPAHGFLWSGGAGYRARACRAGKVVSGTMNEAGHQQRALDVERSLQDLGDPVTKPYISAMAIEGYWGAAFHWIVVGGMRKHSWHTDSHQGLVKQLKALGEAGIAAHWGKLELLRTGGWYTYQASPTQVSEAQTAWQAIRAWATT